MAALPDGTYLRRHALSAHAVVELDRETYGRTPGSPHGLGRRPRLTAAWHIDAAGRIACAWHVDSPAPDIPSG